MCGYGINHEGQLGLNIPEDKTIYQIQIQIPNLKVKQIKANDNYTAVIDSNNNILTCGENNNGQLGLGNFFLQKLFNAST